VAVATIVNILKNMKKFSHNVAAILKRKRSTINVFGKFTVMAILQSNKLHVWKFFIIYSSLVISLVKS
jgi:hypothetical protein